MIESERKFKIFAAKKIFVEEAGFKTPFEGRDGRAKGREF